MLWWDIRKLSEAVESMPLREKGSDNTMGGVIVEYDTNAGPTNFMVGGAPFGGPHGWGEGGGGGREPDLWKA